MISAGYFESAQMNSSHLKTQTFPFYCYNSAHTLQSAWAILQDEHLNLHYPTHGREI